MMERLIFHVDVNSAFVSWSAVEQLATGGPDLREVPSVVGGDPSSRRSIVAAKSIPAKKYGIVTGEPVALACRKCPNLVIAPANFDWYVKCSRDFKAICQEYTPTMQSFSIDEVFLDMTGMHLIYPDPISTAHEIKDRISMLASPITSFAQKWPVILKSLIRFILFFQMKSLRKCGLYQ